MLNLVEKLKTINSPRVIKLQKGEAETVGKLWHGLIKDYLPRKETVIRWHKLLMEYIEQDDVCFAIRCFNTASAGKYDDLRRGFLTQTNDKYSFFYTDNFFAAYFQKMAIDDFVPTLVAFTESFHNRIFPSRFMRNTANERAMLAVPQGKDPGINVAGFKIAHIIPVGKNYFYNGINLNLSKITSEYFPRGERTDWQLTTDAKGTYYLRNLNISKEARKYLVAQYLRFVHPFNYFLAPKKVNEKNSACVEIAEYAPLLYYAYKYNLETYGDIYREYLNLIMIDEKILKTSDGSEIINIEYGSHYKEKKITLKKLEIIGENGPDKGEIKMRKDLAITFFRQKGCKITNYVTYASKNTSVNTYWANPNESFLKNNWTLILNDTIKKKLHLFYIQANTIDLSMIRYRRQRDVLDIQIDYYDEDFTDNRSGIRFIQYKVSELQY